VPVNGATEVHFKLNHSNRATIQFGVSSSLFSFSGNQSLGFWTGTPVVPTLEQIEDGAEVYKLIKKQMSL
jgi:hypothetical protein